MQEKQFRIEFWCFLYEKEQKLVSFRKNPKKLIKKWTGGLFFFKKSEDFYQPWLYLSILVCDFPLIARSGKSHVTIRVIGCAPYT